MEEAWTREGGGGGGTSERKVVSGRAWAAERHEVKAQRAREAMEAACR